MKAVIELRILLPFLLLVWVVGCFYVVLLSAFDFDFCFFNATYFFVFVLRASPPSPLWLSVIDHDDLRLLRLLLPLLGLGAGTVPLLPSLRLRPRTLLPNSGRTPADESPEDAVLVHLVPYPVDRGEALV